jgi:hypothetical protein
VAPDHADDEAHPHDDTIVRTPVVPPRPQGPDLDDTVVSVASARARPAVPVEPARRPVVAVLPAAPEPTRGPRLRMPDGAVVEIEGGTVYIGRRPTLPRVPASGVPRLVTVASPGREVSSTHLAVSAVGGAIVVRDMLSTNGTVVKNPGVPARTLLRGESAVVTGGSTLDLGDGNTIEVLG